ncbi:MAG: hypothetical protein AAGE01_12915 [Pseudomonadota bacterium]
MLLRLLAGAVVVLAVALFVHLSRPPPDDAGTTVDSAPAASVAADRVREFDANRIAPRGRVEVLPERNRTDLRQASRAVPAANDIGVSTYTPEQMEQSLLQVFGDVLARSAAWSAADYQDRSARRASLSGEEAYETYGYLRRCLGLDYPASGLPIINVPRDFVQANCEGTPSGEALILETLDWLTLAASRGFTQAEISYYRSARRLLALDPWTPYRHPDRVRAFRSQSANFLSRAVMSGHHEALAEYALALVERISFAEDVPMAYAYARVAQTVSNGRNPGANQLLAQMDAALNAEQLDVARDLADSLCESFCR